MLQCTKFVARISSSSVAWPRDATRLDAPGLNCHTFPERHQVSERGGQPTPCCGAHRVAQTHGQPRQARMAPGTGRSSFQPRFRSEGGGGAVSVVRSLKSEAKALFGRLNVTMASYLFTVPVFWSVTWGSKKPFP